MKKRLFTACLVGAFTIFGLFAEIPVGYYYKADNLTQEALKTALGQIVANGRFLSYNSSGGQGTTWEGFYYTDRNAADSSVIDMYSHELFKFPYIDGTPTFMSVSGMHIEHALPKSWWGGAMYNSYKDLNHLYPAEGKINSAKNDLPLGIVGEATSDNGVSKVGKNTFRTDEYAGNCFEPADEYKGDFARAYFYMVTAYEKFGEQDLWQSPMIDNNTYPVWKPWALALLLDWHRADPVSQKELDRQEEVYKIQGNRNPFIDCPDLVELIWGDKQTETFAAPAIDKPFLISPTRWDRFNFGVVMKENNQSISFTIEGRNIESDLTLKIQDDTKAFTLSKTKITSSEALNEEVITLMFDASQTGEYTDTIVITGGGLSEPIKVGLRASVTDEFMTLPASDITATEATLNWMPKADATGYKLDVYQGGSEASDLFFSYYIEGKSFNKAIAIYNGTGAAVDLSKYELRKQTNGVGSFKNDTNLVLSGTLANGSVYVLAHKGANDQIKALANKICGKTADDKASLLSFSGNDALALYHSGIQIDVLGEVNNPKDWGNDMSLMRRPTVLGPTQQFDWDEWEIFPTDYYTDLNKHAMTGEPVRYTIEKKEVGNIASCRIRNLAPGTGYTYRITAIDANSTPTVNAVRFATEILPAPIALDPENIEGDAFEPLWESVPNVQEYLIDIYTIAGKLHTETEGFDSLVTNKALLETAGWQFGLTGTSSTAAACGTATPCVAFKNEKADLKTPKLDTLVSKTYADAVNSLTFMYRWGSKKAKGNGDSIATLTLDGYNGTAWLNIDTLRADSTTDKHYPIYKFAYEDGYTQFRWIYTRKIYGSVTLDDVSVTYGKEDTTFVKQNAPWYEGWWIDGLDTLTEYRYRLRATRHNYISDYSNEICVRTDTTLVHEPHINIEPDPWDDEPEIDVKVVEIGDDMLTIWGNKGGIGIAGATENTRIRIYNIDGQIVYDRANIGSDHFAPIAQHGIYIVQIANKNGLRTYKIAK